MPVNLCERIKFGYFGIKMRGIGTRGNKRNEKSTIFASVFDLLTLALA